MSKTEKPLHPEQIESFLALWERSIELSDPRYRAEMEAERSSIWREGNQTRSNARGVLAFIARTANKDTDAGRELAARARTLRDSLKVSP